MMRLDLSGSRPSSFHRPQSGINKPLNKKKLKNASVISTQSIMKILTYHQFYSSMMAMTAMKTRKRLKKKKIWFGAQHKVNARICRYTFDQKKNELKDIADALGLDIQGNRKDLIARITVYFDDFPRFKEDPRFSGLFERARGRKRTNDESTQLLAPPAQRARLTNSSLDTITNTHSFYQPFPSPLPQFEAPMPVASSSQVRLEELPIPFQLVVVVLLMSIMSSKH